MAIPDRVPISHEPGYRTDSIGTFDGGQFFGSVTAVMNDGASPDDWLDHKRWYAVLHRFDDAGTHIGSQIWLAGTSADESDSISRAQARLDDWLGALPDRAFGDIAIKLFHIESDGHVFGLIDRSQEYNGQDHAELVPDDLGFDPPWDGDYDT